MGHGLVDGGGIYTSERKTVVQGMKDERSISSVRHFCMIVLEPAEWHLTDANLQNGDICLDAELDVKVFVIGAEARYIEMGLAWTDLAHFKQCSQQLKNGN